MRATDPSIQVPFFRAVASPSWKVLSRTTSYSFSTPFEGCMSSCASAPLLVSKSRPSLSLSRRPTWKRCPASEGSRSKIVRSACRSLRVVTYPAGLLSRIVRGAMAWIIRPLTRTSSLGLTRVARSRTYEPFRETRPLRMCSSQERLEPSPAAAKKRLRRIPVSVVALGVRLAGEEFLAECAGILWE